MTRIALFAGGDLQAPQVDFGIYVGVDRGSLFLMRNGLPLDMAVGDFDSVSPEELEQIKQEARVFLQAPAEKNDTDLELALKEVFRQFPQAEVTVFGAFGGRIDHMLSNLFLASEPELAPFMQQIKLCDEQNIIRFYPAGQHVLEKIVGMTYISFMPSDNGRLTIAGAKYPLNESHYFFKKCYSSNEFIDREMTVTLDRGYLVVIYSKDRS